MRGNTVTMLLEKGSIARSEELFQYDYGQRLILDGVELPAAYEVHFSNKERGESKTSIGDSTGVDIPDEYLQSGENIHVWLYLHDGEDDGETEYHGIISVHKRAKPLNAAPTPVQQDVITQTIAALDDAVEEVEGIAEEIPNTIDTALQEAKDSGEFDGFSPIANVTKEGHVATITITDKDGTTTATVEDGSAVMIDDNAGAGVKDKTWSADKITAAIGDINSFDIEIVQTLPQTGDEHTIYFVPKTGGQGDSYDEYLYLNGQWEMIGTTDVDVSTKADKTDTVLLTTLSRGRRSGTTVGGNSFAFGQDVTASANNTHAEGYNTRATGAGAHAEGGNTTASGQYSHAEGENATASGLRSHAEGYITTASGSYSHAEGYGAVGTGALGKADHAEGYQTIANSGGGASVYAAHAEGKNTTASNNAAHAEGEGTIASGQNSHAEGSSTKATATNSHAEGLGTEATGQGSHTEGIGAKANGDYSHAEGGGTTASGYGAHTEGLGTTANGYGAHAEGGGTKATASYSHAEGGGSQATANNAHAEGADTIAEGDYSHAEGRGTIARGNGMHAEGTFNIVPDYYTIWTPGGHYEVGDRVINESSGYECLVENSDTTFDSQKWKYIGHAANIAHIVGNGVYGSRSNAYALDWDGNGHFAGDVYVNCNDDSTGGNKVAAIDDTAGVGDTDKTYSADKLATDHSSLLNQINGKQDAPETAGTAGQVLSLDSNLDPVWTTPQSGGGSVDDVQIDGASIVNQGTANIPKASSSALGVVKAANSGGLNIDSNGSLSVYGASTSTIKGGTNESLPITSKRVNEAVFYGLSKVAGEDLASDTVTLGTYPEKSKSAISQMLDAPETVTGTTPSITAKPGVRYICGEVSTLTIVVPSSGCIDVTFTSGSTATVLTVTPPTGMTMKWANGFDPTALEANTTYEINIMDGCLGVAGSWT